MTKQQYDGLLSPRTCPICGKTFIPAPYHVYRMSGKRSARVCSWSCHLEAERRHEAERKEKQRLKLMKNKNEEDVT